MNYMKLFATSEKLVARGFLFCFGWVVVFFLLVFIFFFFFFKFS